MAWEVAQRLNKANVPCNLITGQEKKEIEGAQHSSLTVEMADITSDYQCAVIDEIQVWHWSYYLLLNDYQNIWKFSCIFKSKLVTQV